MTMQEAKNEILRKHKTMWTEKTGTYMYYYYMWFRDEYGTYYIYDYLSADYVARDRASLRR